MSETTSIVEYSATNAALATLAERFKGARFDCLTSEGMEGAKRAEKELKGYLDELEAIRVEIKAPALKRSQDIDGEARRIGGALRDLRDPIVLQIKEVTEAEKRAKIAAEAAEAKRIEDERLAAEAKLKADQAEVARQQEEIRRAQIAREDEERKARQKIEDEARAARIKAEDAERAAQAERDRIDRAAREDREAVERKMKVIEARLEAAKEAKKREKALRESEIADGWKILNNFVDRFENVEGFGDIAEWINLELLEKNRRAV